MASGDHVDAGPSPAGGDLLRAVVDHALDAVFLADDDGRYLRVNPAAAELTGYGVDELLQRGALDLAVDTDGFPAAWASFLAEGRAEGSFPVRRKDGTVIETEFRAVRDVVPGVHLSVMHDITDRVRAEREHLATLSTVEALHEERQRLVDELLRTRAEERRRLSRDLHDDLGQVLTSIKMRAISLRAGDEGELREGMGHIAELAQQASDATRRLVGHLRDVPAADATLAVSLERLARHLADVHHLPIDVSVELGDWWVPAPIATTLHRVASEAVANAVEHAEATAISVVATRSEGSVVLVVEDDGAGFDPTAVERGGGYGLTGMRERVELLGGTLTVESSPGCGTTLRARIAVPGGDR